MIRLVWVLEVRHAKDKRRREWGGTGTPSYNRMEQVREKNRLNKERAGWLKYRVVKYVPSGRPADD